MHDLSYLYDITSHLVATEKMPLLFLGHGNPMNAITDNQCVTALRNIAKTLPKPAAIICISAHWFTKGTKVTAMALPRTIHDFGGFPPELYRVQYPAKGNPILADYVKQLIQAEQPLNHVELDHKWGLDHGTWSVLTHLYPQADIPVIQVSIDATQPPQYHFELAQTLASLRYKGVLIIGSGNIIHNLRLLDFARIDEYHYGYDWAIEAQDTLNQYLLQGQFQALLAYEKLSHAVRLAIPTPDHYLPLVYILGLQQKGESLTLFNDILVGGSLSMTSVKIE